MTDGTLSAAVAVAVRDGRQILESLAVKRSLLVAATTSVGLLAWYFMLLCGDVVVCEAVSVVEARSLRVSNLICRERKYKSVRVLKSLRTMALERRTSEII